ncbi:MAG: AmmeMemoRadiSam system protein B [Pseudomonadota bacterium]
MSVHQPVVAGSFYPSDPAVLGQTVQALLDKAPRLEVPPAKAVVLPHAGYRFSGAVAAAGISTIGRKVQRVVVLGPSHRHAFRGVALPDAGALATPLGDVPIEAASVKKLLEEPDVSIVPEAFAQEHSIEVELPFLQQRLSGFTVVPLVIGEIATDRLAEILDTLWGGGETLIVISTDLTHFLKADEASRIDLSTAEAVEKLDGARLGSREACGHRPLAAFLKVAGARGMRLTRLALTHSGNVTGDNARVVGYGAWMAHDALAARLAPAHRAEALSIAAKSMISRARNGKAPAINLDSFPVPLRSVAPAFVTLTLDGRLRGCIGSLAAHHPLARDILNNAVKAGFEDPRFKPVTEDEIRAAEIEVAVLSRPASMKFTSQEDLLAQLVPGRDGLILQSGQNRGTFLPKVWESLKTPEQFFNGLKVKAGLPRDHWSSDVRVFRYVTEAFKGKIGTAA